MRRSAASRPTQRGAGRSPRGWGRPTGACVILGASAGGAEEFGVDAGLVSGDRVVGGVGQLLLLGGGGIQQSGQLLVVQQCRGGDGGVAMWFGLLLAIGEGDGWGLPRPGSGARPGLGAVPRSGVGWGMAAGRLRTVGAGWRQLPQGASRPRPPWWSACPNPGRAGWSAGTGSLPSRRAVAEEVPAGPQPALEGSPGSTHPRPPAWPPPREPGYRGRSARARSALSATAAPL